jgi:hypothetical protein
MKMVAKKFPPREENDEMIEARVYSIISHPNDVFYIDNNLGQF